jgi:hypothetical protein
MINFTERISLAKLLLIIVNGSFGNSEDKLMFQIGDERFSDENSLWHVEGIEIFEFGVWARADCVQVR